MISQRDNSKPITLLIIQLPSNSLSETPLHFQQDNSQPTIHLIINSTGNMNCLRNIQAYKNMSSSGINPHTTVALQEAGFHLVGCSAYMAIIFKSLSCCLKHTPQYIILVGPIIIWLSILCLRQTYNRFQEAIENWKSDGVMGKLGKRFKEGNDQATGKSKRKNHRGGNKTKKLKAKREDTASSISGEN